MPHPSYRATLQAMARDLETQRRNLDRQLAAVSQLLHGHLPAEPVPRPRPVPTAVAGKAPQAVRRPTVPMTHAIVALLKTHPLRTREVVTALQQRGYSTATGKRVSKALSKLQNRKLVVAAQQGRGGFVYQAASGGSRQGTSKPTRGRPKRKKASA